MQSKAGWQVRQWKFFHSWFPVRNFILIILSNLIRNTLTKLRSFKTNFGLQDRLPKNASSRKEIPIYRQNILLRIVPRGPVSNNYIIYYIFYCTYIYDTIHCVDLIIIYCLMTNYCFVSGSK